MKALKIANLSYSYPSGAVALSECSFSVETGHRVGLIGANGAGKSTLLYHLNGLLALSDRVTVEGLPVTRKNLTTIRQRLGMVFQNPDDQLFCATIFQDVAFGLRNMGVLEKEIAPRVSEALSKVGLEGFEKKSAPNLSAGEKKRAALATVLAMGPSILCLDEPSASLDPKGKRQLGELLSSLTVTQLIVSHDFPFLRTVCDELVVLHEGSVTARGETSEILNNKELLQQSALW